MKSHWPLLKETLFLRTFSWRKIPLIALVNPTVLEFSNERVVIKIPLNVLTRNHQGAMYFGALAIGADCASAYLAVRQIMQRHLPLHFVFKDMQGQFLKRAESDVHFTCTDGALLLAAVERALISGERENIPLRIIATTPSKTGAEPVAEFQLTLSLRRKLKSSYGK